MSDMNEVEKVVKQKKDHTSWRSFVDTQKNLLEKVLTARDVTSEQAQAARVALQRIKEGSYSVSCVTCKQVIDIEALLKNPATTLCSECWDA